jgi:DNA gyrase subunit A
LTYRVTEKTGAVAGIKVVNESVELMLISSDGTIIRIEVSSISILGRATQGVTLMRTQNGNKVVSIARIQAEEVQDTDEDGEAQDADAEVDGDAGEDAGIDGNEGAEGAHADNDGNGE